MTITAARFVISQLLQMQMQMQKIIILLVSLSAAIFIP